MLRRPIKLVCLEPHINGVYQVMNEDNESYEWEGHVIPP